MTDTYAPPLPPESSPRPAEGTVVRLSRRAASPVQSGPARLEAWIAEFEPEASPAVEPLMGWDTSGDVRQQVRLGFAALEEALAWCRRQGLACEVAPPHRRRKSPRSYADNFLPFPDGVPRPIYPH
ncbi:MAG: ETC complex I subunit [Magnetospirillum sp.]|nr:ETC complex I subunit [Magnetospirillum sp.]